LRFSGKVLKIIIVQAKIRPHGMNFFQYKHSYCSELERTIDQAVRLSGCPVTSATVLDGKKYRSGAPEIR